MVVALLLPGECVHFKMSWLRDAYSGGIFVLQFQCTPCISKYITMWALCNVHRILNWGLSQYSGVRLVICFLCHCRYRHSCYYTPSHTDQLHSLTPHNQHSNTDSHTSSTGRHIHNISVCVPPSRNRLCQWFKCRYDVLKWKELPVGWPLAIH